MPDAGLFYHDVLRALAEAGARYVIVGGVAVNLQGVPRFTADVDVAVALDADNLRAIAEAMKGIGLTPRPPGLADPETARSWAFQDASNPLRRVEFLLARPLKLEELERDAETVSTGGIVARVASKNEPRRGFAHHHTDDELRAYRRLSAEQKLRWLHEAWRFTVDFLPESKKRVMQKIRNGEV